MSNPIKGKKTHKLNQFSLFQLRWISKNDRDKLVKKQLCTGVARPKCQCFSFVLVGCCLCVGSKAWRESHFWILSWISRVWCLEHYFIPWSKICLILCPFRMMAFIFLLPAVQVVFFCLAIGRDPYNLVQPKNKLHYLKLSKGYLCFHKNYFVREQ